MFRTSSSPTPSLKVLAFILLTPPPLALPNSFQTNFVLPFTLIHIPSRVFIYFLFIYYIYLNIYLYILYISVLTFTIASFAPKISFHAAFFFSTAALSTSFRHLLYRLYLTTFTATQIFYTPVTSS